MGQETYLNKYPAISKKEIYSETLDKNGDGELDWYLEHPETCKEVGCYGMIFLKFKSSYCFAGYFSKRHNQKPEVGLKCKNT